MPYRELHHCTFATVIYVVIIAMAASLMCACGLIYEYDDCPEAFRVESDWRYAPDADPAGMAYIFFAPGTKDYWRYDLPGRSGGELPLPQGHYSVLCLNDDLSSTFVSEPTDGYDAMRVWTSPASLYGGLEPADGADDSMLDGQRVVASPEQIWCEPVSAMTLGPGAVTWSRMDGSTASSTDLIMTFYPRQIMPVYTYEIEDITNLSGVKYARGALSGLASGVLLSDMTRNQEAVAMPLPVRRMTQTSVGGSCLTFGIPATEAAVPVKLWLFLWLTDGTKLKYIFDVTDQVSKAPDPMNVHIRVGGIDLPESKPGEQGAFDVSVDGWIQTVINIRS